MNPRKDVMWNLWHGCRKYSEGCRNCYVYRRDTRHGLDASLVYKTKNFDLPIRKGRDGQYKVPPGTTVYTCFTSDFFIEDADGWRPEAWRMIKERSDLHFFIITKRILSVEERLPEDWLEGYPNVTICCTVEDMHAAQTRLPTYLRIPIAHKKIICEPLIGPVDLTPYLDGGIESVLAGGESGNNARVCSFDWIIALAKDCSSKNVPFHFKQTGARFEKQGKIYSIPRRYQHSQARKARKIILETVKKDS